MTAAVRHKIASKQLSQVILGSTFNVVLPADLAFWHGANCGVTTKMAAAFKTVTFNGAR
ncbi:MAG: hypothetical protein H6656_11700 [Ardenticatenaceae bacterium]|nr:hypothetical protein [Ardenticatenaceae bacterium]